MLLSVKYHHFASAFTMLTPRLDIPAGDISNILSRCGAIGYLTQEVGGTNCYKWSLPCIQVIYGGSSGVQPSEYAGIGSVQEYASTC